MSYCLYVCNVDQVTDRKLMLKQNYVHSDKCLIFTKGVHRENLQLSLQQYRRRKLAHAEQFTGEDDDYDDESDKENEPDSIPKSLLTLMWFDSVNKIEPLFKDHSTILYLDFLRDVEEITDILRQKDIKAGRYTGQMKPDEQKQADKMFRVGETSVLDCWWQQNPMS